MPESPSREVIPGIRTASSAPRGVLVYSLLVCLQPVSEFLPAFRLSLSLPRVLFVQEPYGPRAVRLLFSCCQHPSPCTPHQSKLQSGKPFGGRDRSLRRRDTPPAPAPVLARAPAPRICDRSLRCARRAPRVRARTSPCATLRPRHPIRHRGKPQQPPLRTRRPARSVCPDRRFSLLRAPNASALPAAIAARRPPENQH